jgi:putative ABC transport system permease protein
MGGLSSERMFFPGRDSMPTLASGSPTFLSVTPGFFKAGGISMVTGRAFTDADRAGAPLVMVVTETMARFVWGTSNALGQCVRLVEPTAPCTTVIGVSEDVRRDKLIEEPMLQFYVPLAQAPGSRAPYTMVVGTAPENVARVQQELRAVILQTLPGSRAEIASMSDMLDPQYRPWRIGASLFTVFGLLALVVAAIGVYSAIAYAVTQRAHELGVRLALGAQRFDIGRIVVGSGVRLVGGGVLLGIIASLALSGLIESVLYGTESRDPVILAGVSGILLTMAIVAASVPAWRASRLDPVKALRAE